MILKPTSILVSTFFVSFSSFSQIAQAFDVAKQLNPAMAGLEYKVNANMFATGGFNFNSRSTHVMGNYSAYNEKHKIGFGIVSTSNNFSFENYYYSNRNLTKLSLNKQFSISEQLQLSVGFGAGLASHQIVLNGALLGNNDFVSYGRGLQLETGVALKGERWVVGLSGGYQLSIDKKESYMNQLLLNVSAAYTFGKADGLQFTPQVLISHIGTNIGGTVKYKSKYALGGGLAKSYYGYNAFSPYLTAGYTIRDKFSINYTYNFQRNDGFTVPHHGLTLSLKIGKK